MLAAQTKYALRALLFLSQEPPGVFASVNSIAEQGEIPSPYLSKIFKRLAAKSLVETKKGVGGGVRISTLGTEATFYEVCLALDEPLISRECVLFKDRCDSTRPCAVHSQFAAAREELIEFFRTMRINQAPSLAEDVERFAPDVIMTRPNGHAEEHANGHANGFDETEEA